MTYENIDGRVAVRVCVCVCRNVGSNVNLTFGPGRRGDVNPEFLNEVVISRRKDDADLLGNYSVFI